MKELHILEKASDKLSVLNSDKHDIPVVISMPHSGFYLTKEMADNLREDLVLPNMDWYLPKLYSCLENLGYTVIINNMSRYVIDPNRKIDFDILDESYIHNFIYPITTFGDEIYKENISFTEVMERINKYHTPYHDLIKSALHEKLKYHDKVYLLDLHSFGNDLGKDIVLGNDYGLSCNEEFLSLVRNLLNKNNFSTMENDHFRGGYITRYYGEEFDGCESLQIELCYKSYIYNREYGNEDFPLIEEGTFKDAKERMTSFFEELKEHLSK